VAAKRLQHYSQKRNQQFVRDEDSPVASVELTDWPLLPVGSAFSGPRRGFCHVALRAWGSHTTAVENLRNI